MLYKCSTSVVLAAAAAITGTVAAQSDSPGSWQLQVFTDVTCSTLEQTINYTGNIGCTPLNVPDNTQFAIINGSTIGTCGITVYDNADCATPDVHSWYTLDWGWTGLCSRVLNTGKIMAYKADQC